LHTHKHTHTHTHTHAITQFQTHTHTPTHSNTHTHPRTLSLSHTHRGERVDGKNESLSIAIHFDEDRRLLPTQPHTRMHTRTPTHAHAHTHTRSLSLSHAHAGERVSGKDERLSIAIYFDEDMRLLCQLPAAVRDLRRHLISDIAKVLGYCKCYLILVQMLPSFLGFMDVALSLQRHLISDIAKILRYCICYLILFQMVPSFVGFMYVTLTHF